MITLSENNKLYPDHKRPSKHTKKNKSERASREVREHFSTSISRCKKHTKCQSNTDTARDLAELRK